MLFFYNKLSAVWLTNIGTLFHFMGLVEIAQEYIIFNESIDEATRRDFSTLCKQMNFYSELIKEAINDEI